MGASKVFSSVLFEYSTQKIVHIKSKKVGIINRLIQLVILGYIIGFVIVYRKGYQEFDSVSSAVTTKVKGIVYSNASTKSGIGGTWDPADYVIPPQESNAFFITTNVVITPDQRQEDCAEDPGVKGSNCTEDADCQSKKGIILSGGNGPLTGKCVNSTYPGKEDQKVCQFFGWCPVEVDKLPEHPVLEGSEDFTVFIKNNIEFRSFGVKRRNILDHFKSNEELSKCRWKKDDPKNKFCPIFILNDIVKAAGVSYDDLTEKGGVMQIVIDWTCNLDHSVDDCVPGYSFSRLDKGDFTISKGFNFRYADKYVENGTLFRTLRKVYGIRFLISVSGKAGKFSIIPLILNLASGIALLALATVICDIVVLYILNSRHFYRDKKFLDVKGQDAFEILDESSKDDEESSRGQNVRQTLED